MLNVENISIKDLDENIFLICYYIIERENM